MPETTLRRTKKKRTTVQGVQGRISLKQLAVGGQTRHGGALHATGRLIATATLRSEGRHKAFATRVNLYAYRTRRASAEYLVHEGRFFVFIGSLIKNKGQKTSVVLAHE